MKDHLSLRVRGLRVCGGVRLAPEDVRESSASGQGLLKGRGLKRKEKGGDPSNAGVHMTQGVGHMQIVCKPRSTQEVNSQQV